MKVAGHWVRALDVSKPDDFLIYIKVYVQYEGPGSSKVDKMYILFSL